MTEEERKKIEEQAEKQWEHAQKRMEKDGYGKYDDEGDFIWKKKVNRGKLIILNPPRKTTKNLNP